MGKNKFYYPLWYRLNNKDRYLIWFTIEDAPRDLDGVFVDGNGRIPVFMSIDALFAFAKAENLPINKNAPGLHNLDTITKWLKRKHSKPEGPTAIDCSEFLLAWNLFADISRTTEANFDSDQPRTQKIYEKLFWGNNLPAITPEGRPYIPLWSRHEKQLIRDTMRDGLQMFRSYIKRTPSRRGQ